MRQVIASSGGVINRLTEPTQDGWKSALELYNEQQQILDPLRSYYSGGIQKPFTRVMAAPHSAQPPVEV